MSKMLLFIEISAFFGTAFIKIELLCFEFVLKMVNLPTFLSKLVWDNWLYSSIYIYIYIDTA